MHDPLCRHNLPQSRSQLKPTHRAVLSSPLIPFTLRVNERAALTACRRAAVVSLVPDMHAQCHCWRQDAVGQQRCATFHAGRASQHTQIAYCASHRHQSRYAAVALPIYKLVLRATAV